MQSIVVAIRQFCIAGRNDGRLYKAVRAGDRHTVLSELGKGDIDPNLRIRGKSMLHHAGEYGFNDIARALIEHGADPNQTYGKQQRSLLHFAVATGNYGFLSVLLEAHANPSAKTTSNATPLHFASRAGEGFMVARLLAAGASAHALDRAGRSPLNLAISHCRKEIENQLRKADENVFSGGEGAKVAESAKYERR